MPIFDSIIDTIGGTPLVRLHALAEHLAPDILLKLEYQNPGGSVKDRAALWMVRQAERDGLLQPGGTIVETTSGNTGIGLALVAAHLGYRSVIFASSQIAAEKIKLLRAFGAEVRTVDTFVPKAHPESLSSLAARFVAETPGAWRAGQYDNPANPQAHIDSTGPEIWADTDGRVTHFVATVGTGGTITGTGESLKTLSNGAVRVIAADPDHSAYGGGDGAAKLIEGAGHAVHADTVEDIWPESFRVGVVDEYVRVSDRESILFARRAAREEGILLGGSGGTALAAGLRLAKTLTERDTVVILIPDSGRNALSTYFDDEWLADRGVIAPELAGRPSVRDILRTSDAGLHRVSKHATVEDALSAFERNGLPPKHPVLVFSPRGYAAQPIESELLTAGDVVGVVIPQRLRDAVADGAVESGTALQDAVEARPFAVGIDVSLDRARHLLGQHDPHWETALVTENGHLTAAFSRTQLEATA